MRELPGALVYSCHVRLKTDEKIRDFKVTAAGRPVQRCVLAENSHEKKFDKGENSF